MEKVSTIRDRFTAYSQQEYYAENWRRELEFEIVDWFYLKVSPMKGGMRFAKKCKLSPPYVGSYEILKRVWKVTLN